jgi:hypothetical protein
MEMTFEDGMQESMLPIFDMEVGDDGLVKMADSDEYAPVYNEVGPIEPDEIVGFVKHPRTGECVLLRDNFCDICDYVREEDEVGELTRFLK